MEKIDLEYLQSKIKDFQKLKTLKQENKRLIFLNDKFLKNELSNFELKELKALIVYEKSLDKLKQNKKRLAKVNKNKRAQINKSRNTNLAKAMELLFESELVDKITGELLISENSFLGALFSVKKSINNQEKMKAWENKAIEFIKVENSPKENTENKQLF